MEECDLAHRDLAASTAVMSEQRSRIAVLESALRWVKEHGSKHGMPDEVFAILETIGSAAGKDCE